MADFYGVLGRAFLPTTRPAGGPGTPASAPRRDSAAARPRPRRDGAPLGEDSYIPDPSRTTRADSAQVSDSGDALTDSARPRPGEAGKTMMGKIGGKLAEKALFNEYGYRPPSVRFSQYGGVGFDIRIKPLKADDGLVQNDPNRQATIERFKKEGKSITWTEMRGAVTPSVGIPLWNPVGPVNLGVGLSASASLGVSVLFPVRHDVKEAASNLSVNLPFDADTARELTEGTEVTMRGTGGVAVRAGTRVGDTWVPLRGPWSLGTSIGADSYVSKSMELVVRVKRLDGDKVFVSLSEIETDGKGASASARVGVHSQVEVPDSGNEWVDRGRNLATKTITRQIEKWLSLEARAIYSRAESEREIKNYVLDLSRPEARKAYEDLVKLDTRKADQLDAQGPESGVWAVWLTEQADVSAKEFRARLGGLDLVRSQSRAEYAHGRLFTRQGRLDYDRAQLENKYEDIITRWWKGERETRREFVETRNPDGTNPRSLLHVRNEVKVGLSTPTEDVRRFMVLARYLGVSNPDPAVSEKNLEFLSSFGRSQRVIDFALNPKGLERLLSASDDDLHRAFAAGYEELDKPWEVTRIFPWETDFSWRKTPWLEKDHPRYAEIIEMLEAGPERTSDSDPHTRTRDEEYFWLTGRPLWQDSAAYKEAKDLVDIVGKLRRASTPGERSRILKEESGRLDVDCIRELAMLAKVAGRDGLRVQELWIRDRGKKKTYAFTPDGPIADPSRTIVDGWLNNPEKGPSLGE